MQHLLSSRRLRLMLLAQAVLLAAAAWSGLVRADEKTAAIEQRLAEAARHLASEELEGRGVGTKGLDLAAEYIAGRFAEFGLTTELLDGTPFQVFQTPTSSKLGNANKLALVGQPAEEGKEPVRVELKLGEDFTPLAMSGSGHFDLPLVFVGYGITAKEENYDDYAGVVVAGKAVLILRHEPQQADPESVFSGTEDSEHAPFRRKVSNAFEHEAKAVVFCSDEYDIRRNVSKAHKEWQAALDRLAEEHADFKKTESPTPEQIEEQHDRIEELLDDVEKCEEKLQRAYDPLLPFTAGGRDAGGRDFPIAFCRRAPLNRVLDAALGTDLSAVERGIDEGPTPRSAPLPGWRVVGEVNVERKETEVKNVLAALEGEGPLAEETLVIGAHYDHLGGRASGASGSDGGEIYHGADDNASGVAVLLEVARTLAERDEKLRRRVLFIAFTAEERGLLGSNHYLRNPLFPIQKTIAMLNLDMVGRLRDDKLTVGGSGTATRFDGMLDELNQSRGFQLNKTPSGFGPSDHSAFYGKKVPVIHFFTGMHGDLHRTSDDFEKLNVPGMRRVGELVAEIAVSLANAEKRPEYLSTGPRQVPPSGGERPFFGSIPDFSHTGPGYAISGVVDGSPAQKAGLRAGDVIVRLGESKIGNLEDFDGALRKHKAGQPVPIVVERAGQEQVFEATLDTPR
ncbi:MAG TPA: M20/M25/M40 family metallo-hydrolase [Thermoguttaceae bacterium]|nr:M20/M25/M40 family metallo-hydrolase [Thermoguttaceae bacterium]